MIASLKYGGASGSHWEGCEAQHWDCLIVSMRSKAQRQSEVIRGLVGALDDIRNESAGVAGWHRNGDVADWDEFQDLAQALAAARELEQA